MILLITKNTAVRDTLLPLLSYMGPVDCREDIPADETYRSALVIVDSGEGLSFTPDAAKDAVYWPFPLNPAQVAVGVRQYLNQARPPSPPVSFAGYTFHSYLKSLTHLKTGRTIYLTDAEALILDALAKAPGMVLSAEDLQVNALGYSPQADSHTLATHIYRLRQKIEADPADPRILVTTDKGYGLFG